MVYYFVKSYFGVLFGHDNPQYPICAKSRNGFAATFSNFPLLWLSKLQKDNDIYNLNSEYVAFSHYVRDLLPLKIIIKKLIDNLVMDSDKLKFLSVSTVYEDNSLTIDVATSARKTPTLPFGFMFNVHF